jgi:DNA adenine methylase
MSDLKLKRPLVRYHGGKWRLAPKIISFFPQHRVYVEPFGGGGSVLLRKARSYAEIYNDLDGEISNLFKVARDRGEELARRVELTPFSRAEFIGASEECECALERARRTLVRSFMGFGSASITKQPTGFRANSNRSGTTPAHDWANYPASLREIIGRLRGVVIENRSAVDVMRAHDQPDALHYVDPPYVFQTRCFMLSRPSYRFEMSDDQHVELSVALKSLTGSVLISGYRCDLYDSIYCDWDRVDFPALADGAKKRVESLWLNKRAAMLPRQEEIQFDAADHKAEARAAEGGKKY